MKMIFRYMRPYWKMILFGVVLKLLSSVTELLVPYILEHMIDEVVPAGEKEAIWIWGGAMVFCALITWLGNIKANHTAVDNAHNISYDIRRDLFDKTISLCGSKFDKFGLPSLTSRMTSDSYNVQNFVRTLQTMCIRAPIMLLGGINRSNRRAEPEKCNPGQQGSIKTLTAEVRALGWTIRSTGEAICPMCKQKRRMSDADTND